MSLALNNWALVNWVQSFLWYIIQLKINEQDIFIKLKKNITKTCLYNYDPLNPTFI